MRLPKIGDGFIEIHPDWSAFGAGFGREVEARLAAVGDGATLNLGKKLRDAVPDRHKITVDIDVDRDRLAQIGGTITNSLGNVLQGVSAGLGGLLSRIPGIGGIFAGLSSSLGTTALGAAAASAAIVSLVVVLAALAASLGAAVAGLGALTIAFGLALGPAVLVTIAAIARFVTILKAVKDHNDNASQSARGIAAAQDQLRAATEAVANAQANLREQTVTAYTAWADAVEQVRDDLFSVQTAEEGIRSANLSTREAQQALVDFRNEAKAAGREFDQVFKKFTDVNVDTSGLKSALAAAGAGQLKEGDELRLERLIQNVRDAKLREKSATEELSDSTRKLGRDRKVEADFAQRGIKAYAPYRDALKQVASAQRQSASAQRASAAAVERQTEAWDKLTPAEKKFGDVLIALGDTLKKVFTPVMAALLDGVTRGLESFSAAATDPKIGKALTDTGKAMGDAFASIAKTLTSPEMRQAFVDLAEAGARIIRTFGTKVFQDLSLILARIAIVTLPLLLPLLDKVADWLDGLEHSSRNTKNLSDDISHLVGVFETWAGFIISVSDALIDVGRFLEPIGTAIVKFLAHPLETVRRLFGFTTRDAEAFGKIWAPIQRIVKTALDGTISYFRGMARVMRGVIRVISGILTGDFRQAWDGVKDIFRGGLKAIGGIFKSFTAPFGSLGKKLGEGLMNALIKVLNLGIAAINAIIGTVNKIPGVPNIGKLDRIDLLGGAGTKVDIKERGPSKGPASRGDEGRFKTRASVATFAGAPTEGGPGGVIQNFGDIILPPAPAAAVPDARFQARQFALEVAKKR